MTPLNWAARVVAAAAHEVIAEYRKLDPPPPAPPDPDPGPVKTEHSCTSASVRDRWQPHTTAPASPQAFGFAQQLDQ